MLKENKKTFIAFLIGAIIGSCLYFFAPTKEVVITKEVVKTKLVEQTDVNKNTVTKIIETQKPDGSKVTETLIENKDQIRNQINLEQEKKTDTIIVSQKEPLNRISLKALVPVSLNTPQPFYELNVSRSIWGPVRLEGAVDTRGDKRIGIVAEFNF